MEIFPQRGLPILNSGDLLNGSNAIEFSEGDFICSAGDYPELENSIRDRASETAFSRSLMMAFFGAIMAFFAGRMMYLAVSSGFFSYDYDRSHRAFLIFMALAFSMAASVFVLWAVNTIIKEVLFSIAASKGEALVYKFTVRNKTVTNGNGSGHYAKYYIHFGGIRYRVKFFEYQSYDEGGDIYCAVVRNNGRDFFMGLGSSL